MLFEAGDLIYQPGSKSYEETISHIRKKYDMKYKRNMYTYLRKYDEPQRKHKSLKNILKRCFQKERIT